MHILHIIGLVGAGKTTFIQSFLPVYPCFDIKEIFESCHYSLHDLQSPSIRYFQFAAELESNLLHFFDVHKEEDFVLVESSGVNNALNNILTKYTSSNILVTSKFHLQVYEDRPYAKQINALIRGKLKTHVVPLDSIYDWTHNYWVRPLPVPLQPKLPELY